MNTEANNTIIGASINIATPEFTLPPGDYHFYAWQRVFYINGYDLRLWNKTDNAQALRGPHGYSDQGAPYTDNHPAMMGYLHLAETKTFEFQIVALTAYSSGFSWDNSTRDGLDNLTGEISVRDISTRGAQGPRGRTGAPVYVQATEPTGDTYLEGDLWVQTS
jgi:hypothetical protein